MPQQQFLSLRIAWELEAVLHKRTGGRESTRNLLVSTVYLRLVGLQMTWFTTGTYLDTARSCSRWSTSKLLTPMLLETPICQFFIRGGKEICLFTWLNPTPWSFPSPSSILVYRHTAPHHGLNRDQCTSDPAVIWKCVGIFQSQSSRCTAYILEAVLEWSCNV